MWGEYFEGNKRPTRICVQEDGTTQRHTTILKFLEQCLRKYPADLEVTHEPNMTDLYPFQEVQSLRRGLQGDALIRYRTTGQSLCSRCFNYSFS